MKTSRFICGVVLAVVVLAAGCATKPTPDPLAGWELYLTHDPAKIDTAIVNDYRNYIQALPPKERYHIHENNIWFYQDSRGRHAVRISIPLERV